MTLQRDYAEPNARAALTNPYPIAVGRASGLHVFAIVERSAAEAAAPLNRSSNGTPRFGMADLIGAASPPAGHEVAMDCPKCARPMRPLFISMVCDYCDGLVSDDEDGDEGFIVWQGKTLPAQEYVFSNRDDAERWREYRQLDGCPIVSVRSPVKFRWRKSNGTIKGLEMADALVTIFEDKRFPVGPNRAYVIAA